MVRTVRSALRAPNTIRGMVPLLSAFFAALAIVVDPGRWWESALQAVPVLLFAAWYRSPRLLPVIALPILVITCLALWNGALEPGLFAAAMLALCAAGWENNRPVAAAIVLICLVTPPVIAMLDPPAGISWPNWVGGIVFPAVLGVSIRRLERVTNELAAARRELADRAVADERRRISRDVHDLVGHGLAAVLLQLTSARHVLHRDPQSADDALRTAEEVGRRSMQELRRTVDLLRRDDDHGGRPLPGLDQLADLVETYRTAGLSVSLRTQGELDSVDPAPGLTTYRIAQQSLANAARHAPDADTVVILTVADRSVTLTVDSVGPAATSGDDSAGDSAGDGAHDRAAGGRHGLVGMRERARVAGGELWAGSTDRGWSVRCVLPVDAGTPLDAAWKDSSSSESSSASLPATGRTSVES